MGNTEGQIISSKDGSVNYNTFGYLINLSTLLFTYKNEAKVGGGFRSLVQQGNQLRIHIFSNLKYGLQM